MERLVPTVLVVEDEETVGLSLRAILEAEGYQVEQAAAGPEALAKVGRTRFDVLLLDLRLGDEDGLAVLRRLKELLPGAAGIILTRHLSLENAVAAMRAGADDFLLKPTDASELKASIARALHWRARVAERDAERTRLDAERDALRRTSDERVGALEELNRLTEEFIAAASHDLKSPLTSIRGYAQLLRRRIRAPAPDLAQIAHGLDVVDAQAQAMTRLLDDLLDVSRIQAGAFDLRTAPCDLGGCLEAVLARLGPGERERVEVALADAPLAGEWDRQRVEQVLANLLGNALKYSPPGERVRVVVERHAREVEVAVEDRGMGVPPRELPRLFERFHRTPQALASGLTGTGLGLYIARGIVEAHGGRIWAESPGEGRGATFRCTLPTGPAPAAPGAPARPKPVPR
jgi:signal transduction histidine kinase